MAEINVGGAIGAGFSLIRHRPLAVWAWGGVTFALVFVAFLLMGSALIPMLTAGADPEAFERDPGQALAMMAQLQGVQLLLSVGNLVLQSIILAAVFRAVLHPEQGRWAYMRLGMAELFLLVLRFGAGIVIGLGAVLVLLPFIITAVALGVSKQIAAAIIVGVVGVLLVMVAAIYIGLRLSLAGPMIVADNEFRLVESWRMTKGRVGPLFLTAVCMVLVIIGLEIGLVVLFGGAVLGALAAVAGGLGNMEAFFRQSPGAIMGVLTPIVLGVGIIGSFVAGCFYAVVGAPWAEIYRQLAEPDPAKTFG